MIPIERWSPADGLTLEPNALAAATEITRSLVLTAGGAGKTEMLAQRADFLLRTGTCRYPRRILAISFKTDASQNLKARVRKRCGPSWRRASTAIRFTRSPSGSSTAFVPFSPDAMPWTRTIRWVSAAYSISPSPLPIWCRSPIISSKPAWSRATQCVRPTHVFLDEFQDCTAEQYRLILACFGDTSASLTAVGDTKQSIMGWAGALEGIFLTFAEAFDALPLNLYQNFRSAPRLRRMQNAMVKVMDPRLRSKMTISLVTRARSSFCALMTTAKKPRA
jgi:superfamily I DNA/RNA helicase